MSRRPRALVKVPVEIYGCNVAVSFTRAGALRYARRWNSTPELLEQLAEPFGGLAQWWTDADGAERYLITLDCARVKTCAHEAVHIANRILTTRGVLYTAEDHEALAYLVGYLANAFYGAALDYAA